MHLLLFFSEVRLGPPEGFKMTDDSGWENIVEFQVGANQMD